MKLQGGYIIDEIFNLFYQQRGADDLENAIQEFSKHCFFEFLSTNEFEFSDKTEKHDKILLTAYNILNRGTPTRASLFITEKVLSHYGFELKSDNKLGEIVFVQSDQLITNLSKALVLNQNINTSQKEVYDCIYIPILIAQIQKVFLLLWLNANVNVSNELKIHCNESLKQYFEWAFFDLFQLIQNLNVLKGENFQPPVLSFVSQENASFSLGINEQGYNYQILTTKISEDTLNKVLTSKKIVYPAIGNHDLENKFIPYYEKHNSLLYFLNNLFRKKEFRDGQLGIINRILQCKDVIGILPTGSGKSLTYQICTLLQPGITIIIDPIRSLMIDQYDKLRENFIDKVLYINSFDSKKERLAKEKLLSEGKAQYAIIGPERFQILEFRNFMRDFVANRIEFSYSVIDEAHCISEWGHDFRYSYLRLRDGIFKYCFNESESGFNQIALTATASFDVIADIQRELKMAEDVLVSIPPEAINREELKFIIENIPNPEFVDDNAEFFIREKEVGRAKYPKIKQIIQSIPDIPFLELDQNSRQNFFQPVENRYKHCGLIFCPTKSDTLGNGVVANLKGFSTVWPYPITAISGLEGEPHLSCTTFMGQSDDGSIVADLSSNSFENQKAFLANKHNLMIATKAFGMGIDKPNIRYTIHYSIPQSVESFYQEAGRAGRDREYSVNYILYNQFDVETNKKFIKNAHKSFTREGKIYNEILTEIKYETKFFSKLIENHLNESFFKDKNDTNKKERFRIWLPDDKPHLYVFNCFKKEEVGYLNFGYLDINDFTVHAKIGFENITNELKKYIKLLFYGESNIEKILRTNKQKGLEDLINESGGEPRFLNIGFENDTVEKLIEHIPTYSANILNQIIEEKKEKVKAFKNITDSAIILKILKKKIILDAYDFTNNEDDIVAEDLFLKNINFEYKRLAKYKVSGINLSDEANLKFRTEYWKIRSEQDTMRAIYRLSIIGVIDDYVVDYKDRIIFIKFSGNNEDKNPKNWGSYLESYLRRYLGQQSTDKWLKEAIERQEETEIRKYLFTLTDFFKQTIGDKRLATAELMNELCQNYVQDLDLKNREVNFRRNIVYYFTSKYATALLDQINKSKNFDDLQIFIHFLKKIENPPENEVGLELSNAKHIIGACSRYKTLGQENYMINLLNSFCTLLLEGKVNGHLPNFSQSRIVKEQLNISLEAFYYFSQKIDIEYKVYATALNKYTDLMSVVIPETKLICSNINKTASLFIIETKLNTFINKFVS